MPHKARSICSGFLFLPVLLVFAMETRGQSGGAQLVQTIDFQGAGGAPGMRFGDLDGDGQLEIVVGQPLPQSQLDGHTPQEVVRVTAFSVRTGGILWQYTRPGNPPDTGHVATSDIPLQVYDWDGDGAAEVIAAFSDSALTFLDGTTGQVKRTIPIPEGMSDNGPTGSNDCIIIANLRGTAWPQDFIVKTRYTRVWGINGETGEVLWTYGRRANADNLAHFGYAFDADGDGRDEYLSGWQLHAPDGTILWEVDGLELHLDASAVGDLDGNPANGKEVVLGSNIGVVVHALTGEVFWRDTASGTVEIQQMGVGDFMPSRPGREVVLLDRIGPRGATGRDANVLLGSNGELLWRENRIGNDYGWLSVTERITNWDGTGRDQILSYRRTSRPPTIYDGNGQEVAAFPHPGSYEEFAMHADLCGDDKEEVVIYNETTAWIFANGGCDLNAPPRQPSQPQNRRHYNWTIYSGWEDVDHTFYTPGATRVRARHDFAQQLRIESLGDRIRFRNVPPSTQLKIWNVRGELVAASGVLPGGEWAWGPGAPQGVYFLRAHQGDLAVSRRFVVR